MQNKLTNHDRIAHVIEHAVIRGSGFAAAEAASTIDEEFILIKKSDLPEVTGKPHPWREYKETPMARTAGYHGRSPETYWNRAMDFISVALYAEQQESEKAERAVIKRREEAYAMLYPSSPPLWDYNSVSKAEQSRIDVVVDLMRQVDELKSIK